MPDTIATIPRFASISTQPGARTLGAVSEIAVFNTNSLALTGTGSGENDYRNPYGVLAGTVTNHGNVRVIPVPPGASQLDLFHEWVVGGGADPTTFPQVAAFGSLPARGLSAKEIASRYSKWPNDIDSDFTNPGATSEDWRALQDASANCLLTLPPGLTEVCQVAAASRRCPFATFYVVGHDKVMVTIGRAGVGPDKGMIVGNFVF